MNESISFAAGNQHGQELAPPQMEALVRLAGRTPVQRTTIYGEVPAERVSAAWAAQPLLPVVQTPLRRRSQALRAQHPPAHASAPSATIAASRGAAATPTATTTDT
jgi:phage terminase large subunit-like protein